MKRHNLKLMAALLPMLLLPPLAVTAAELSVKTEKKTLTGSNASGYYLVYKITPDDTLAAKTYKCDNTEVCSVASDGTVTFNQKGKATITITADGYDETTVTLESDKYIMTSDCNFATMTEQDLSTAIKREASNYISDNGCPKSFASCTSTRVRFPRMLSGTYYCLFNSFAFNVKGDYFYTFAGYGVQLETGKCTVYISNAAQGQLGDYLYRMPDSEKTPDEVELQEVLTESSGSFSLASRALLQRMRIFTPESALATVADIALKGNSVDLSDKVVYNENVGALTAAIGKLADVSALRYVNVGHVGYGVTDAQMTDMVPSALANSCFVKLPKASYFEKSGPNIMKSDGSVYSYVFDPTLDYTPAAAFKATTANVKKSFASVYEYYPVCLPFDITYTDSYGTFFAAKEANDSCVAFKSVDEVKAGKPYLFKPAKTEPFMELSGMTFSADGAKVDTLSETVNYVGTYSAANCPSDALLYADGTFTKATESSLPTEGLFAYITSTKADRLTTDLEKIINPIDTINNDRPIGDKEKLTRGLVALPSQSNGIFLSWRMLTGDDDNTTFDIIRDGQTIKTGIALTTSYNDETGTTANKYQVVTRQNGAVSETSEEVTPWTDLFKQIPIERPHSGTAADGSTGQYYPNDCSTGDVDGDGEYEIVVKWEASSPDNSQNGYTCPVLLDCYKLDGTKLWRIDLGLNIRSGAHYTQFLVYDFDGDGKAELICKTAPGSKDGAGRYVSEVGTDKTILAIDNSKIYVNSKGHVSGGEELLTVFNGETGKAIHTIYYNPNRGMGYGGAASYSSNWGDGSVPYNRGERYLACVAFLEGPNKNPSAVMCRGYYTRAFLWAVNFNGQMLYTQWLHASTSTSVWSVTDKYGKTTEKTGLKSTACAQGAHNVSVGDIDNDGCDEIIYGSAAIDHDGTLKYSTDLRHGDAQHLGDLDPDRDGLEFFMVLEKGYYGFNMRNANTGKVYVRKTGKSDTGRGMAADIDPDYRGYEMWSTASNIVYNCKGDSISGSTPSMDFRIYWDGDLQDELLGDVSYQNLPYLEKWNTATKEIEHYLLNGKELYSYGSSRTCNYTKGTPSLTADLFGDWREEMVFWCGADSAHLNIFTTNCPTEYRFPTLMHDRIYRLGVA